MELTHAVGVPPGVLSRIHFLANRPGGTANGTESKWVSGNSGAVSSSLISCEAARAASAALAPAATAPPTAPTGLRCPSAAISEPAAATAPSALAALYERTALRWSIARNQLA